MDRHQLEVKYWDASASMLCHPDKPEINDNWKKRRNLIKLLLDYDFTDKRVIEIGCGLGFTASTVLSLFGGEFDYTGTDISPIFSETAKRIFKLDVKLSRSSALPFEDDEVDCCFAFDVLEHIHPDDQEDTAKELNRVLKPASRLFINNPDPHNPCGHDKEVEHGFTHWDLAGLAQALDMQIERIDSYEINHGEEHEYKYQFIVLSRGRHHPITSKTRRNGLICDEFRSIFQLVKEHMPNCIEKKQILYHLDTGFNMGVRMSDKLKAYKEGRL